jgi:hypothetical protein
MWPDASIQLQAAARDLLTDQCGGILWRGGSGSDYGLRGWILGHGGQLIFKEEVDSDRAVRLAWDFQVEVKRSADLWRAASSSGKPASIAWLHSCSVDGQS